MSIEQDQVKGQRLLTEIGRRCFVSFVSGLLLLFLLLVVVVLVVVGFFVCFVCLLGGGIDTNDVVALLPRVIEL